MNLPSDTNKLPSLSNATNTELSTHSTTETQDVATPSIDDYGMEIFYFEKKILSATSWLFKPNSNPFSKHWKTNSGGSFQVKCMISCISTKVNASFYFFLCNSILAPITCILILCITLFKSEAQVMLILFQSELHLMLSWCLSFSRFELQWCLRWCLF